MESEFTLSSGIHRGATFTVADELVIIGADPGCDICLSDAGLAPRHLALVRRSNGVSIRSLEGQVSVNGELLAHDTHALLSSDAEVALGESGVRIQYAAASAASSQPVQALPEKSMRITRHKLSLIAMPVLLMTGVVAAALSARPLETASNDVPDIQAVQALLQREQLAEQIRLSRTAYGVQLTGVVDAASAAKLRGLLANTPVANTVITDQELLGQIRDVFRTHGYEVEVTYVGNAQARIENLDEAHERVRRAAETARADIPMLRSLSFASVGTEPPPERPTAYRHAAGHRFTVHLTGQTAYLASADGSRYFTGSMLPDGHSVRRITERAVLMDREGQLIWMRF